MAFNVQDATVDHHMSQGSGARERVIADIERWDAILDHRTGTAGDRATDDWLGAEIERVGLAPEVASYPFDKVEQGQCYLEIDGTRIEGVPLFDGSSLGNAPILGRLNLDFPVVSLTPFDQHPLNAELGVLRRETDAAAIVAVGAAQGVARGLALINAERYRDPGGPAVLQVASEHAERIRAAADREVALRIDLTRRPSRATNVGTTIQGADPDAAPVVVMTPKSAWWTCTAERIGGIVIWLELLRRFAAERPRRTLHFTANSGHELSHLGLDHYLATHEALATSARCWIHLGANFAARNGQCRVQASDQPSLELLSGALARHDITPGSVAHVDERPWGEARNIYDRGGTFVSLLGRNAWFHHPDDRWPDTVDLDGLVDLNRAIGELAEEILNA